MLYVCKCVLKYVCMYVCMVVWLYVCMYVCMYVSGTMVSLTQRRDSELELITGDSLGQLLYWDIDVRDPVMAVQGNLTQLYCGVIYTVNVCHILFQ